jgi:CubicO group peptidase (beta-lactamase class C family)
MSASLAAHIPRRVRPPATYSSYSNYGAALAGLIVANVSGMSFEEYVEKNIFDPLGMSRSTFREPLSQTLAPDMATSYRRENGAFEPGHFELISNFGAPEPPRPRPTLARFAIARSSRVGRIESCGRDEHAQRIYFLDERLPGMAHGF